jgi:hypothetical protein
MGGPALSRDHLGGPWTDRSRTAAQAVPDLDATVAWYRAVGFELAERHGEDGTLDYACLTFGAAAIMFVPSGMPRRRPQP